ncbi:MAG: hypothetical protein L0177_15905 [Chloroflexi bacterium]|nr:hypothetical protein [Chloroflexota bacterium]
MNVPGQEGLGGDWLERADEALGFIESQGDRDHILYRFDTQYLPALVKARAPSEVWRVWEAFRFFVTARPTRRKPFTLTEDETDRVIGVLSELLGLPRGEP